MGQTTTFINHQTCDNSIVLPVKLQDYENIYMAFMGMRGTHIWVDSSNLVINVEQQIKPGNVGLIKSFVLYFTTGFSMSL